MAEHNISNEHGKVIEVGSAIDSYEHLDEFGKVAPSHGSMPLPLAEESIIAGFPAPNGGYIEGNLDVNEYLIDHPSATFIYRVSGDSMIDAGIMHGDFVLVDTSREVREGNIVVACVDGSYTIKKLVNVRSPRPQLLPCNSQYGPIEINEFSDVKIIGPVISVVRKYV